VKINKLLFWGFSGEKQFLREAAAISGLVARRLTIANCVLLQEIHHVDVGDSSLLLHQSIAMGDFTTTGAACNESFVMKLRETVSEQIVVKPKTNITGTFGG
jgi:hypothetical protein